MKTQKFKLYGDLQKVEEQDDGTLIVSGIASSESEDSQGEIVKADAIRAAIPDYMRFGAVREMHGDIAAGTAISIEVDDEGVTKFEAHIVDEGSCKKVRNKVLKGFSIGGKKTQRDTLNKSIITGIKLTEISLVDRPSNPDSVFTLVKMDKEEKVEDLKKGMYAVSDLASMLQGLSYMVQGCINESTYEGDQSPVPAKLKEWLAAGVEVFNEMAAEESAELLEQLKAAEAAGDLQKVGQKYSKDTKAKLAEAHDHINKAADCMNGLGYMSKEDDMENAAKPEDLKKVEGVIKEKDDLLAKRDEELAKVSAERDDLRKSVEDLGATVEELTGEVNKLLKKVADNPKGAKFQVPTAVDKKDDVGIGGKEESMKKYEKGTHDPDSAKEDIRKALRGEAISN